MRTPDGARAVLRAVGASRPEARRFGLGALAGAAAQASAIGLMATSAWLIARAAQQPPVLALTVAVVTVRGLGIARGVFRYLERLVTHDAALRVLVDTRVRIYRRLEPLAPAGLPAFRRGDLLSRLVADVDTLQDLYLRVLAPPVVAAAVAVATVGLVTWLLPAAGLLLAAGLVVAGVVVPLLTGRLALSAERRVAPARGDLSAAVTEVLDAAPDLIAYGVAEERLAEVRRLDAAKTALDRASARWSGLGAALGTLAAGGAVVAALGVGVPAVRGGTLDGVLLAVVVLTPLAAFEAVAGLPLAAQQAQRVRRAAQRLAAVEEAVPPVVQPEVPTGVPAWPFAVRARGLRVRWPGQPGWALDGVDLDLAPGRRVAVVGSSGAGKSSLAAALLRFVEVGGGSLRFGEAEVGTLDGDDVRRVVGWCAQDAHVFHTTVRENLLVARPEATDGELAQALRAARLLERVEAMPKGLDTLVGEDGARLSGGERQRLALARALLADPPVLLLDEPAAHLDPATGDALTADLLAATAGRTTLLVTHRLTGLDSVDEVLVLSAGRVVQRGTHETLLARPGPYRRMWEREREAATLPIAHAITAS